MAPPPSEQTVWADVAPFLDAVTTDLEIGELIHGENFSLFEAMSALEIMDPKMDAGITSHGFSSVEEAIQQGFAPVNLSILQTVDIMDYLLACEATWHKGHTLAQTVFSCIYLLNMEIAESNILLSSYCRTVRQTCNLLRSVVSQSRTHEEEDFFTLASGLPLKGEGDEKCLSSLNAVEETVARQLRASRTTIVKKQLSENSIQAKPTLEDYEPLQPDPLLEEGYCKAVLARLRFRKSLYHIFSYMAKSQGKGLEMARKHIRTGLSELATIRESTSFLSSLPNCKADSDWSTTASGQEAVGFDARLNSRLLSPTPPRALKILSWIMALDYFGKLLQDLDKICSIAINSEYEEILQFIVDFQKSKPDLVARSYLQILLIQDGKIFGQDPPPNVIFKALNIPGFLNSQQFRNERIVTQLGQLMLNLVKILCTNIAWQRRKLGKCLQEWGIFLHQAEMLLYSDGQHEISNDKGLLLMRIIEWAEEKTYWIASRFLMLGFDLDLYFPSEFCMVYWYLEQLIMMLLQYKIKEKSDSERERAHKDGITLLLSSSAKKKTKKRRGKEESEKEANLSQKILLFQCYMHLSKGLMLMLANISKHEKTLRCPTVFNTEQERFIQTFDLLQKSRIPEYYQRFIRLLDAEFYTRHPGLPEELSYAQFVQSTKQCSKNLKSDYFDAALKDLKRLRHCFPKDSEKLEEVRKLEVVAEKNKIAMNIILLSGLDSSSLRVSFEFSVHPVFAIAVIKRT